MAETKTKLPEATQPPAAPPAAPPPAPTVEPRGPRIDDVLAMQARVDKLAARSIEARRRQQVAPASEALGPDDSPEQKQAKLDAKAARIEKANEEISAVLNKIKELRPQAEALMVGIRVHYQEKGPTPAILTGLGIDGLWDLLTLNSLGSAWVPKQRKRHGDAPVKGQWNFMPNGLM